MILQVEYLAKSDSEKDLRMVLFGPRFYWYS